MVRHIIYFEWKNIIRNKAIIWLVFTFLLILGLSIYNGTSNINYQLENIKKCKQDEQQRFENLLADIKKVESGELKVNAYTNPKTPYMVGGKSGGHEIIKMPHDLSFISMGLSDYYPYHYQISLRNQQLFSFLMGDDRMENPVNQLNSNFDLAFVLIWLLPLFIIAFSYNVLSSEKEQGTFKLLKAQPVSITRILIIKILLRFVIIIGIIAISICLFFSLFGVSIVDNITAIINLLSAISAYVLFWFMLSILVNLFNKNSSINAGILFTSWLLIILIIPTLLNLVANYKYPVSTRIEYISFVRDATCEIDNNPDKVLDKYFSEHPELGTRKSENMPFWVYTVALKNKIVEEVSDSLIMKYKSQLNNQIEFISYWKYFSPAIILQQALDKLSGNSTNDFLKFQAKADEYNYKWRRCFFQKILKDELLSKDDVLDLPRYSYEYEKENSIVTHSLFILACCVVVGGLIFLRKKFV
ncbi:MAG: ABC transporter permease subunit [Bacteroidetes bacterium]|nr:ABC transporter permease subunit [Bacteroidota bacterium]